MCDCGRNMTRFGLILAVTGTFLHVAWSWQVINLKEDCDNSYCLSLYRSPTPVSWQRAYVACGDENKYLVPIPNAAVQERVEQLIQPHGMSAIGELWIAGKQKSDENSWTYINGRPLAMDSVIEVYYDLGHSDQNCIFKRCETQSDVEYYWTDNCAEENGHHQIICQKPSVEYSETGPYNLTVGDYSYRVMPTEGNWFSARNLCVEDGGDLIHTPILDATLRDRWDPRTRTGHGHGHAHVLDMDTTLKRKLCQEGNNNQHFWFGLTRYSWQWQLADSASEEMKYYNWQIDTQRLDHTDWCASINRLQDVSASYKWLPKACTDTAPYFICANGTIPGLSTSESTTVSSTPYPTTTTSHSRSTSTSTLPTTAIPTPTAATNIPTAANTNAAQKTTATVSTSRPSPTVNQPVTQETPSFKLYYIAVIGVAAILIIVIPVVIVVCRSKKQKQMQNQTDNPYLNGSDVDPGYASADTSDHVDDVIEPYGDYRSGASPAPHEVIQPYGEYQPESSSGTSINNTSANKKLGEKPATIIMASESNQVPHVMTDEGNMYAMSLNDKRLLDENVPQHILTEGGDLYAMPMKGPKSLAR